MRLKYLAVVGVAIFFVMVVANCQDDASVSSSGKAVVLLIDNSDSMRDYPRFEAAKSYIGKLDSGNDWVHMIVSNDGSENNHTPKKCASKEYRDTYKKCFTQDFGYMNNSIDLINSSIGAKGNTDIDKLLRDAINTLDKCFLDNNISKNIVIFSDGEPDNSSRTFNTNISDPNSYIYIANKSSIKIDTVIFGNSNIGIQGLEYATYATNGDSYRYNGSLYLSKPSIAVSKYSNAIFYALGARINYTIEVQNTGDFQLYNVSVCDQLPDGVICVSSSGGTNIDQYVNWSNLEPIQAWNEPKKFWVVGQIGESSHTLLTNFVTVRGVTLKGENVTANASLTVPVVIPSISVNKIVEPSSGSNGTLVNFTINVTNTGNVTLDPVIITDTLPFGLDEPISSHGNHVAGNVATWNMGKLEPGNRTTVWLEARINGSKYGELENKVNVTGTPPTSDNVTDDDTEPVEAKPSGVSVNKTADPSWGSNGTLVNFTIGVTNTGSVNFTTVTVKDTLPTGLRIVSSNMTNVTNDRNVTWTLKDLNASKPIYIQLVAQIDGSKDGNLTNFVEVDGRPERGNNFSANTTANVIVQTPNGKVVVFALDTSGSMKKYYHLAPNESAEIVSTWSHFGNATVSIVSWDHDSELLFGPALLKGNETRLAGILDNLSEMCIETDLTYYDQGLNGSLAELRDPASVPPNSSKIIVFLTGYSEFEAGEKLDEYISEANELGCKVFTIGIGINESFEASKNQQLNLTKISEGTGGIFSPVAAFSPGDLNPIMEIISRELEGDLMYAESEPQ